MPTIMRKSVVLPAPFGPMTPTMPPGGSLNERLVDEQLLAEALCEVIGFDHDVAEPRSRAGSRSRPSPDARLLLRAQLLVGAQAGLALRLPRAGRHAHPLELAFDRALARAGLLLLGGEARLLLLEPRAVVALERVVAAAVELEDPLGRRCRGSSGRA
jgi:hypothetical protein